MALNVVSSKLSSKTAANRKPVVCRSPPKPPVGPLVLTLIPDLDQVLINELLEVELYGDHPARPLEEPYVADWFMNHGVWNTTPASLNRKEGIGFWQAPHYPCTATIRVTATWPDTAQLFTLCTVRVITY